ncbi:MAG: aminotransferase class III-fold pyridoxal phosphate-dependent enzyme [Polyangiaceae bacterium]|nr:aminotransferase class III-fold pyridoxal phosphate-dependent enzyme [Polyangiaceae bacterium]
MSAAHRYPESDVFYRDLTRSFPNVVRGEGIYLYDSAGRQYLDACGGAYVANVGHGVREIADAIGEQAARVSYINGTAFTSEPVEEMATLLTSRMPRGDVWKAYFLCSGSEAVEAALKLARQYWVLRGKTEKDVIVARTPGYHGNTMLALAASARGHYKKLYQPWLADVEMIAAPYPYRCACDGKTPCEVCDGDALERAILRRGPHRVAAFIAEPVGGSSTGASVPKPSYHAKIRSICDKYDVLYVADEVLSGAGRTGTWLAMEHFGVTPDIVTMGKGISGGYAPLSAVLAPKRIIDVIAQGAGALKHAQTFSHFALGCAAGVAAIRYIEKNGLVQRCAEMGNVLHKQLEALKELPVVGDVRGMGLLAGIEIVADKAGKKPFPRAQKVAEKLVSEAQDRGLVLWSNIGHADGENGDLVTVAPAFVITEAQIDELIHKLRESIVAATQL